MKHRMLTIGVAIALAFAALTVVAGCSQPMTLEKHLQDNPSEWTEVEDQLKDMSGEMFTLDVSVEGNNVKQIMTYTETFDADSLAAMKEYFQNQEASLVANLQSSITSIEKGAGVEGVTWFVQFNNGDGTEIYSTTVDMSTAAASAPAATSTGTGTGTDTSVDISDTSGDGA